jgi:hypothetical protein
MIEVLKDFLDAFETAAEGGGVNFDYYAKELRQLIAVYKSAPPEAQTEAEKTAYAFGWWKALELQRAEAENKETAPVAKNESGRITWLIEDWPQNCLLYTHTPPQPIKQEPVAWVELLREARDNCKASIVEDGISALLKEYRIDLEARLTAALNTSEMKLQAKRAYSHDEKRELAFIDGWLSCESTHGIKE